MERVVKIIVNDDGDASDNSYWHYVYQPDGADRTLCSGEVFGYGEGRAVFEERSGRITCPNCISIIRMFHKVKL